MSKPLTSTDTVLSESSRGLGILSVTYTPRAGLRILPKCTESVTVADSPGDNVVLENTRFIDISEELEEHHPTEMKTEINSIATKKKTIFFK